MTDKEVDDLLSDIKYEFNNMVDLNEFVRIIPRSMTGRRIHPAGTR